eukprot:5659025-Pyramimonas_sp.AAC.1
MCIHACVYATVCFDHDFVCRSRNAPSDLGFANTATRQVRAGRRGGGGWEGLYSAADSEAEGR